MSVTTFELGWAYVFSYLFILNVLFSAKYALQQHKNGREEWKSKKAFGLKSLT